MKNKITYFILVFTLLISVSTTTLGCNAQQETENTQEKISLADATFYLEYIINPALLQNEGMHSGMHYDNNGNLRYIYIVDNIYDKTPNKSAHKIKIWKISDSVISKENTTSDILFIFQIKNGIDFEVTFQNDSLTISPSTLSYIDIESISFNFVTTEYSYISRYVNHSSAPKNDEVSLGLDYLLGKTCPVDEKITDPSILLNKVVKIDKEIQFDKSSINVLNEQNNLRSIGFNLTTTDLNNDIFTNKLLGKYSFYQMIEVKNASTQVDTYMQLKVKPTEKDSPFIFEWDIKFNTI